jgi:hypothetical protein
MLVLLLSEGALVQAACLLEKIAITAAWKD